METLQEDTGGKESRFSCGHPKGGDVEQRKGGGGHGTSYNLMGGDDGFLEDEA